jgi:hypothetical protein
MAQVVFCQYGESQWRVLLKAEFLITEAGFNRVKILSKVLQT